MSDTIKSILQLRDPSVLDTGYNPIGDLQRFVKESESRRQESIDSLEKAKLANSKWIDISEPTKIESVLPPYIPKGKLPVLRPSDDDGEEGMDYDWKIEVGEEENTWNVGGGDVRLNGQGTDLTVPTGNVSGASGTIYLKISRDESSRAASTPEFGIEATMPASDQTYQYFRLGTVGGDSAIIQKQFQPISMVEDLFVANGEFRLGNIAMMNDNLYDLPT